MARFTMSQMSPLVFLFAFVALFPSFSHAQLGSVCFANGTCAGHPNNDYTKAIDSNHCLFDCFNNTANRCEWFTYKPNGECMHFPNCTGGPVVNATTCTNCVSGQRTCNPVYECEVPGIKCQARTVGARNHTISSRACLEHCKEERLCEWYTYDTEDRLCVLYENCMHRVPCANCISGENDCSTSINPDIQYTMAMVVGGRTTTRAEVSAEVVDLTGTVTCNMTGNLPVALSASMGTFIGGRAIVCGGKFNNETDSNLCYSYNVTTRMWVLQTFRLIDARSGAASINIDANRWWILGGTSPESFRSSTEIFDATTNTFTQGPVLPRPLAYLCVTQVDTTRFQITGGASIGVLTTNSIYNFQSASWLTRANMPVGKYGHFCGTSVTRVGSNWKIEVVVAAGSTPETYVYDETTNLWTIGAIHPRATTSGGSSFGYEHSFVTLGGSVNYTDIYVYNNTGVTRTWTVLPQKMRVQRHFAASFLIPSTFYPCNSP